MTSGYKILGLISFLVFAAIPRFCIAANFSEFHSLSPQYSLIDNDVRLILMEGPVEDGDSERFLEIVGDSPKVTVVAKGPGGLANEAYSIGAEINLRGYATMVLADTKCYSACALIWVSGARRYMSESSVIGFHQVAGGGKVSGQGNAEYGSFLNTIGINKFGVHFLSSALPEDFEYLTPALAWALGIEIYLQSGLNVQTPEDRPSMPKLAQQFTALSFLATRCSEMMGFDSKKLERKAYDIGELPNKIVHKLWIEAFTLELDLISARAENVGNYETCASTVQNLSNFPGLIESVSPSFNCSLVNNPNEQTICQNQTLSALDRGLSHLYSVLLSTVPEDRAVHQDTQQTWLSLRQSCGQDAQCISDLYLLRASQIQRFLDGITLNDKPIEPTRSKIDLNNISYEHATLLQLGLSFFGFYDGMQDGDWGERSLLALKRHQSHLDSRLINQDPIQNLIDTLKYEHGQHGWKYGDHHRIGASYLFPTKGLRPIDPVFAGSKASYIWKNAVVLSVGKLTDRPTQAVHQSLLQSHDPSFGTPYLIRKNNLMVTVARRGNAFTHLRSERTSEGWSSLYVNAGPAAEGYYWAIVGSISLSRTRDFSLYQQLLNLK